VTGLACRVGNEGYAGSGQSISIVMPGLVPGIHVFLAVTKAWMAGTSPAMTLRT
jgi:hypothetical protein